MSVARSLLLPVAWLYGGVLALRHALYDRGILHSERPAVPTIVVGNLALGGTGKTPHVELVLRTLDGLAPLTTLSRGYGRTGTSFLEVREESTAREVGDEPLQLKRKFPATHVFVGADRVNAIHEMARLQPDLRAVVLDDAFQHRRLNAGLNILLTTWQRPWCDDALLPVGRLRDLPSRSKAAQIVVVTKCPTLPSAEEQKRWRQRLGLLPAHHLFFSGIAYNEPSLIVGRSPEGAPNNEQRTSNCLLFTGIADPAPLVDHAHRLFANVEHVAFPDHHPFSTGDLERLADRYAKFAPGPKTLLTTEKDAMRLRSVIDGSPLAALPLAVIGMRAMILNEPEHFTALIRDHVATHPAHR
ncbi:MAG: tetraacyldisaccharide 4'-kinase [Flavobacteriales bacterium]